MAIRVGDLVKFKPELCSAFKAKIPFDSICQVTCDQIYQVDNIYFGCIYLVPKKENRIGSDGLSFDTTPRGLGKGLLVNRSIDESFDIVNEIPTSKPANIDDSFCCCGSTNTAWNTAGGKDFIFCRGCKKERKV